MLDERPIRVDFDWGFKEGRQYGRGRTGGQASALLLGRHCAAACRAFLPASVSPRLQIRDELRTNYDEGRGGFGNNQGGGERRFTGFKRGRDQQ